MSTSAQQAVQELKSLLEDCLKAKHESMVRAGILNLDLANDLQGSFFPEIPKNFWVSYALFHEFFNKISHPNVTRRLYPHPPVVFSNIFMAIKKPKVRLNVFKRILPKICEVDCQFDALFAVMRNVLHHPVYFNHQSERFFILKCMIITRIEQRRRFPPGPGIHLTHIQSESLDEIIYLIFNKHGLKDRAEGRSAMESELSYGFNAYYDREYSTQIKRILESDPKIFRKWEPALKKFFSRENRTAKKEQRWLSLLRCSIPDFWKALRENGVCEEAISWILYWYVRHMETCVFDPSMSITFSELMTRLVRPDQMSFPFREPPKLFLNDDGHFRDLALRWGVVSRSDLLEIFDITHKKNPGSPIQSQCVLAAFVRRKLSLPLQGNQLICQGLFDVFIRPINLNFFCEYMRVGYGCHSKQSMLKSKYALEKQNPFLHKYLDRCIDSKYLLRLKNMPFWFVFIRKIRRMMYSNYS
jgi:hypothetical protein